VRPREFWPAVAGSTGARCQQARRSGCPAWGARSRPCTRPFQPPRAPIISRGEAPPSKGQLFEPGALSLPRPPGLSAPCRFRRPVGYDHDDEHGPPHFEVSPPNPFRAVWKTAEVEASAGARVRLSSWRAL
jgi:hypothetical protein